MKNVCLESTTFNKLLNLALQNCTPYHSPTYPPKKSGDKCDETQKIIGKCYDNCKGDVCYCMDPDGSSCKFPKPGNCSDKQKLAGCSTSCHYAPGGPICYCMDDKVHGAFCKVQKF